MAVRNSFSLSTSCGALPTLVLWLSRNIFHKIIFCQYQICIFNNVRYFIAELFLFIVEPVSRWIYRQGFFSLLIKHETALFAQKYLTEIICFIILNCICPLKLL